MSSNIKIQRICQHCGTEFTARTTVTKYCSKRCGTLVSKARIRAEKVQKSNAETIKIKTRPITELKEKEILTVKDVSILIGCSIRTAYRLINNGTLKAVNLSERLTRVKKNELMKLLEQPKPKPIKKPKPVLYEISDCLNLSEVQNEYGISEKALYELIKRNSIPKIKKGKYAYVPKPIIEKLLT
ncbi:MAG: DNA-binding protein [Chitinophagaceae bacterium]|nr:MAG: DNA-binding protein [Chitinophagaceae bacterium]